MTPENVKHQENGHRVHGNDQTWSPKKSTQHAVVILKCLLDQLKSELRLMLSINAPLLFIFSLFVLRIFMYA